MVVIKTSVWVPYGTRDRDVSNRSYLLAFPYAGGGASVFRRWGRCFPQHQLLAIELPGRETRFIESSYEDLECLTNDLTEALDPYVRDSKIAIFDHSMGALVGYEFARSGRDSFREMTHNLSDVKYPRNLAMGSHTNSRTTRKFRLQRRRLKQTYHGGLVPCSSKSHSQGRGCGTNKQPESNHADNHGTQTRIAHQALA